jgi:hypothetical protein
MADNGLDPLMVAQRELVEPLTRFQAGQKLGAETP